MLTRSLALLTLLVMIAAPVVIMTLPGKTEAGPITVWSGKEYYKCVRDDGKTCVDKWRYYSESYEPSNHRESHRPHETNYVYRDNRTTDIVTSCSGCCAPW